MRTIYIIPILMIIYIILIPKSIEAPPSSITLQFQSETHQSLGSGCYNAQVNIILTNTDPSSQFFIQIDKFYLYATGTNLRLSNSTNYSQPNNKLQLLVLFPSVPVTLILSFTNFCLPSGLTSPQVWLFYFDGVNTLKAQIV